MTYPLHATPLSEGINRFWKVEFNSKVCVHVITHSSGTRVFLTDDHLSQTTYQIDIIDGKIVSIIRDIDTDQTDEGVIILSFDVHLLDEIFKNFSLELPGSRDDLANVHLFAMKSFIAFRSVTNPSEVSDSASFTNLYKTYAGEYYADVRGVECQGFNGEDREIYYGSVEDLSKLTYAVDVDDAALISMIGSR